MDYLAKHIRENPLQWIIQGVAVLVVIANVFIAFKLAPIARNLDRLTERVSANEADIADVAPVAASLTTDVAVIKSNIGDIKDDLKDIKKFLNVR